MPVAHWRKGRPYPQMRRYTMWSFAFLAALPPLIVLLDLATIEFTALDFAFLVALTALAVTAALSAAHLTLVQLEDRPLRVPLLAAHGGLSIVAAALSFFYSGPTQELGLMGFSFTLSVVLSLSMLGIAAGLRTRVSLPLVLVLAVAVAASWQYGAQQLPDPPALSDGRWFPALFASMFLMLGVTLGVRMSVWTLDRVYEQGAKAAVEAQLAVAEERLRFSRDLHDIFGRTLNAVVVKSELAAQLADAGQHERATTEMREVRALSDEALREVRAVVAGYRDVDLGTELAGARAMLAAAGIATRIIGDPTSIPETHSTALAWAVREGVTNVVRHSSATRCRIEVGRDGDHSSLVITNDGAHAPGDSGGSGLSGLAERLAPLGGSVSAHADDGEFTLRVSVGRHA